MADVAQVFADDIRAPMFALAGAGRAFALATIMQAAGGPRPVGSQMLVDGETVHGFLSDGCIDADVALHAREVLAGGAAQRLVYGSGSPFIDLRLPCGGRIEVLVERVPPDDPAVVALERLTGARTVAIWESDGDFRACRAEGTGRPIENVVARHRFEPCQRLIVVGSGVFATAIAALGAQVGWEVALVDPSGKEPPPPGIVAAGLSLSACLARTPADRWTAVAVATHEADLDHRALVAALASPAAYVGVLGARRRLPERLVALRESGVDDQALARLHAPIGLPLGAETPREVAVAVVAEILADRSRSAAVDTNERAMVR